MPGEGRKRRHRRAAVQQRAWKTSPSLLCLPQALHNGPTRRGAVHPQRHQHTQQGIRLVAFVCFPFWHNKTPHLLFSISYCLTNGVQFTSRQATGNFEPQETFLCEIEHGHQDQRDHTKWNINKKCELGQFLQVPQKIYTGQVTHSIVDSFPRNQSCQCSCPKDVAGDHHLAGDSQQIG